MDPIAAAAKAIKIRRLTRSYERLNKLNASEQSKADKAAITARLNDYDRF